MARLGTAGFIALVAAALVFGSVSRVTGMRVAFCTTPDELAEVMPGLRLHALSPLNVSADVRSNFLASALYSQHGLGDTGFYYVTSLMLGVIGVPLSERNLWLATGAVNGLLIGLAAWLLWLTTRNRAAVAAAIGIMAVSPFYVFTAQSGWGGRLTFVPLIQVLLLVLAWLAHGRPRSWALSAGIGLAAAALMLTDGFFFVVVVLASLLFLQDGSLATRVRALSRNRVFWSVCLGAAVALAVGVALAVVAAQRGTRLTLYRHAFLHAGGGVIPSLDVIRAWMRTFQWYFPHASYFWVVLAAWTLAVWRAPRSPIAATLALWWLIIAGSLVSYTTGLTEPGQPPLVLGWANGPYHLAVPSYLLIAWAYGSVIAGLGLWPRIAGGLVVAAVALPLAVQTATGTAAPIASLRGDYYGLHKSDCQVVKAASYYVRREGTRASTVFHLSNDQFLGYIGEFYYGLSYSGNLKTGERNQLLDFGEHVVGRKTTPEEFARAYAVPYFDYYVEFLASPDPFATQAVERLHAGGARPVFEILDEGRPIGRVWSFHAGDTESVEFADAARGWDRFATLDTLIQQPLTGTTYHFGHSWILPN